MKDAVKLAEKGIKSVAEGKAVGDKFYMGIKERGFIKPFAGYNESEEQAFVKVFSLFSSNPGLYGLHSSLGIVVIVDASTGAPVAIMEASWVTAVKTGASTAVTAKHLANRNSKVAAIIGAGFLGKTHLEGLCEIFEFEEARVVDLRKEARDKFAGEMSKKLGLRIEPLGSVREAVRGADVVVFATTANKALMKKTWLEPGMFIAKMGSYREIDTGIVTSVDKVVVDNWKYTSARVPELIELLEIGAIGRETIHAEYPEIVAGIKEGRKSTGETILYIALGIWGEYAAILPEIYRRSVQKNLGKTLKFTG